MVGIYGPGRHYLLDRLRETNSEIPGSGEYALNMIHLEDIVGAICATLSANQHVESGIFNISDDTPSLKVDVLTWLAKELDLPPLILILVKFLRDVVIKAGVCDTA